MIKLGFIHYIHKDGKSYTRDENEVKNPESVAIIHRAEEAMQAVLDNFEFLEPVDGKWLFMEKLGKKRESNDNQRDETVHNSQVWNDEVEGESLSDANQTGDSSI